MSRSRAYCKNDNAHVEQKNWTHVRELLGYERFKDLVCGCVSNPGLKAREVSLDLAVPYERGHQADAVRLSNPFWIDDDTFGWLEIPHYFRPDNKPHGKVGATLWLMTYHLPTAEQTRELYLVTGSEYRRPLDTVRLDRDIFVRIYPRHYSDVIEKDLSYRISPGNNLHVSDQTGRHFPLDYRFGLHLSGQALSTLFDAEDREARRQAASSGQDAPHRDPCAIGVRPNSPPR